MKEKDFAELLESIRQAGQIMRGERAPSRIFTLDEDDIQDLRMKVDKTQSENISHQCESINRSELGAGQKKA
jgi:putative transcriptional regulator